MNWYTAGRPIVAWFTKPELKQVPVLPTDGL